MTEEQKAALERVVGSTDCGVVPDSRDIDILRPLISSDVIHRNVFEEDT